MGFVSSAGISTLKLVRQKFARRSFPLHFGTKDKFGHGVDGDVKRARAPERYEPRSTS